MKNNSGFMLIELIIATLIASMIGTLLLTILYQGNQMQVAVDDIINISERVAIVANTLEKDLAGAFVPAQSEKTGGAQKVENIQTADTDKKAESEKKTSESKNQAEQKNPQKKEPKLIEKIFYSISKNGMLDTLTFITNNPLVVFVGKDVGVVKPKVVRVQYTLKPDIENKDSYTLFRQESNELDLAEYKNVRPYEVIGGIKKLTVTFTARIEKKQEKKEGQVSQEKQKKEYEYKTQPEWVSEQKEDKNKESDKKEPEFPRIPYCVEFKMIVWDKENKKDQEFTFVCIIPVDSIEAQQKDKKQSVPTKKEQQQKNETNYDKLKQPATSKDSQMAQVQTHEVVVYNGIEALNTAMNSLKKLLGQG